MNYLLLTFILIVTIQNLRPKELNHGFLNRTRMQNIETYIHNLIHLIRLIATRQTLHLALQGTPEYLLHRGVSPIEGLAPLPPQLLEAKAGVVARVDHVPQELVRVLLPPVPEVVGEQPQAALDLVRRVQCRIRV